MEIIDITTNNFEEEVLKSKVPVLLDFWAVWCGPCRIMGDNLKELAEKVTSSDLANKIKIAKLDIDNNGEIAEKYGVRSIPTLILFKDGETVATEVGIRSSDDLLELINNNIA
ncbi:thioredoxin [Rickettsiales bacterium LUAb2]